MKAWIGIDSGKSGAIAVICEDGDVFAHDFTDGIASTIKECYEALEHYNVNAVIESVHSFPGQGVSSSFAFGRAFGEAIGALDALGVPYRFVSPQAWQKGMGLPKKKDGASAHKAALKTEAQRRYPSLKPTLKTADAILIADYARYL